MLRDRGRSAAGQRVLLVCDDRRGQAENVRQHIAAFSAFSAYDVRVLNPRESRRPLELHLEEYAAVVIHYTILISSEYLLPSWAREQIAAYDGLKIQFLQDEYRWVDE